MWKILKAFTREEDGLGTVEIVIIIAVLVGVALIFRDSLVRFVTTLVNNVFNEKDITDSIDSQSIRKSRK